MVVVDSPLFKFSTTKDTPPTHGAENKNVDKWIRKSLINSTFHNWLPLKFKAIQKGPKCSSFWQNPCHSKGKLLLCILSLIFIQLSIFGSQSWGGERGFDHIGFVSVCMCLSNLVLGSPSPANKIDTFKTNYCGCKHRWSEPNQPKNLFIYPPPPKKEKIEYTSTSENIIFWGPERLISLKSCEG